MKKILLLLALFISTTLLAQNKLLTMEDAMVKNRSTLAAENLKTIAVCYIAPMIMCT